MSIPSCIRPQRHPNGLVTGPLTGHWSGPFEVGGAGATDEPRAAAAAARAAARACASRIAAAIAALCACSASISPTSARSSAVSCDRSWSFSRFEDARSFVAPTSSSRASRVWAVRTAIARAACRTLARTCAVRARVVELVECVRDRGGAEKDVERRHFVRLVDVDQAVVEPLDSELVLPLERVVPLRLQLEELRQLLQPVLVEREVLLERPQAERDVADLGLERPDPARYVRNLAAEDVLLVALLREVAPELLDPRVDRPLPVAIAGQRRRRERERKQEPEREPPHVDELSSAGALLL